MNAAALLGRLKVSPRSLWPRRGKGDTAAPQGARRRWRPSRPSAVAVAYGVVFAALAGTAAWLATGGEHAGAAWTEAIPQVRVAVDGGAPLAVPAAAPADAAADDSHTAEDPAPHTAMAETAAPAHGSTGDHGAAPDAHAPPGDGHGAPAAAHPPAGPANDHAAAPAAGSHGAPAPAAAPQAIQAATAPDARVTMTAAPVPALVEESRSGPLPRIGASGRTPAEVYARPFPTDDPRPRIAIIMSDMGLSGVTTGNALQSLPGAVTLAFVPFGERLDTWVEKARSDGHEVMLSVPMEPEGFPRNDPGPNALLSGLAAERNQERLLWSLAKAVGYVGITSSSGSKFTASAAAMQPVIDTLKTRGLLYVDPGTAPASQGPALAAEAGVPRARIDRVIDRDLSRGAIDDQLRELERLAKAQGAAIGIGFPYPSTIERIKLWATGLQDRGLVLAPVSAVTNRQKGLGG